MPRRRNAEIRKLILLAFSEQALSIRELALRAGVDWYTAERHLSALKGRDLTEEVFSHRLLRLYRLSLQGRGVVKALRAPSKTPSGDVAVLLKRYLS